MWFLAFVAHPFPLMTSICLYFLKFPQFCLFCQSRLFPSSSQTMQIRAHSDLPPRAQNFAATKEQGQAWNDSASLESPQISSLGEREFNKLTWHRRHHSLRARTLIYPKPMETIWCCLHCWRNAPSEASAFQALYRHHQPQEKLKLTFISTSLHDPTTKSRISLFLAKFTSPDYKNKK